MNIYNNPLTQKLVRTVCDTYHVTEEQIGDRMGRRPRNDVAVARQVICYLNTKIGKAHYTVIMRLLGYAEHTPICKNIKRTRDIMSVDEDFREQVEEIERLIENESEEGARSDTDRMAA